MKTKTTKSNLLPANGTKNNSVISKSKRTAKKSSSATTATAKKKLGTTAKVVEKKAARAIKHVTKQADAKNSTLAHRTAARVTDVTDPSVERFPDVSARPPDHGTGVAKPGADAKSDMTKRTILTGANPQLSASRRISSDTSARSNMKLFREYTSRQGKIGYILAWVIGIPVPILFFAYILRGCD